MDIGHRANDCKNSEDVGKLIEELVTFKDQGTVQQNERLDRMECIATELYGGWGGEWWVVGGLVVVGGGWGGWWVESRWDWVV